MEQQRLPHSVGEIQALRVRGQLLRSQHLLERRAACPHEQEVDQGAEKLPLRQADLHLPWDHGRCVDQRGRRPLEIDWGLEADLPGRADLCRDLQGGRRYSSRSQSGGLGDMAENVPLCLVQV